MAAFPPKMPLSKMPAKPGAAPKKAGAPSKSTPVIKGKNPAPALNTNTVVKGKPGLALPFKSKGATTKKGK